MMFIFSIILIGLRIFTCGSESISKPDVVLYLCNLPLLNETNESSGNSELTIPAEFSSSNKSITFKLEQKTPECPDGNISIGLNAVSDEPQQCKITPSGMLEGLILTTGHNYADQYCIESHNETTILISACRVDCANPNTPCIDKCCGPEEGYHKGIDMLCQSLKPEHRQWRPVLHAFVNDSHDPVSLSLADLERIRPHFHKPNCPHIQSYFEMAIIKTDGHSTSDGTIHLRMLQNGSIFVQSDATGYKWKEFPPEFGTVCVDSIPGQEEELHLIGLSCDQESEDIYDQMEHSNKTRGIINQVHAVLMILCSVFLLGTIAIYILLWEKQNIHGWTVMSYVLSLFCMYILLATNKLVIASGALDSGEKSAACWTNGFLAHFAFLSTFAWLTVINFDIWWKFRAMNPNPMKSKEIRRYIYYAIFAFGAPLLVLVIGLLLKATYPSTPSVVTPNYGAERSCFLAKAAQGFYIYYPVGVLMSLNFIFFFSTAITIFMHYKATENIHDKKSKQQRESFKMIFKLCVVMGSTWVFELLSFIFDDESGPDNGGSIVWSILDCVNILQALGIFYIFVWKRQILTQLWQKYPSLRPFLTRLKGLPGCKRSTIECHSSTRMTTKSTNKSFQRSQSRKPSLGSSFETVEL